MRARYLVVPAIALAAAVAHFSLDHAPAGRLGAAHRASSLVDLLTGGTKRPVEEVQRRRYVLDYRHEVSIDGRAVEPTSVKGIWATTPLSGDRVAVELTEVVLGGVQDMPKPADVTEPFQIATEADGHLDRLGFAPATPVKARGILTTVACALWYTPGDGDRWTVEEEDPTGRYRAVYERRGDEVVRRRDGYLAVREGSDLSAKHAGRLSTEGATRYRFDPRGLVEVAADEHLRMAMGEGLPTIDVHVQATLRLLASDTVVAQAMEPLPLEALRGHGQGGESSKRDIEVGRLGGAKLPDLLAELDMVHRIERGSHEEQVWQRDSFLKLRALLRVDPGSTGPVVEALKAHAADDPRMVSVLAGALGGAGTKEATDALVELTSAGLPDLARMQVVGALNVDAAPSAASIDALTAALDDGTVGSMSALALGAEAGKLAADDPATAAAAVGELLNRYAGATDPSQRLTYLNALANSGAPEALPVMSAALAGDSLPLAEAAAYGLRFIPGDEADALLKQLVDGASSDGVKAQASRAIAYRTP